MCNCLFGFSLEGVNVVLQMLDLLCKLKNDVMGLQVCSFEIPLPPLNFAKEKMTKKNINNIERLMQTNYQRRFVLALFTGAACCRVARPAVGPLLGTLVE